MRAPAALHTSQALVPTLFLPGFLGAAGADAAWHHHVQPYLENGLPIADRVAVLCAALEAPEGGASWLHATGLTLLGQTELVSLAATWKRMSASPGGAAVLQASMALGPLAPRDGAPDEALLHRAQQHLGARAAAWREVLGFAVYAHAVGRSLGRRLHASPDARLPAWLAEVAQARRVLGAATPKPTTPQAST
jgi:hypothetical protein